MSRISDGYKVWDVKVNAAPDASGAERDGVGQKMLEGEGESVRY